MRTPTGNISCFLTPAPSATLHCRLRHADYAITVQHVQCGPPVSLDWAGFELTARAGGSVACSGGILYDPATQKPHYVTVPYGRAWHKGPYVCGSRVDGLTCRNRTGHGFFISRRTWRVW